MEKKQKQEKRHYKKNKQKTTRKYHWKLLIYIILQSNHFKDTVGFQSCSDKKKNIHQCTEL